MRATEIRRTMLSIAALSLLGSALPASAQLLMPRFRSLPAFAVPVGPEAGRQAFAVADLNGDAQPDLATIDPDNEQIAVYLGRGDGAFDPADTPVVEMVPTAVAVADLVSPFASEGAGAPDGVPDLVVGGDFGELQVLPGLGDGRFAAPDQAFDDLETAYVVAIVAGDFDGEPGNDIALLDEIDGVFLLCNDGAGQLLACGAEEPIDIGFPDAIEMLAGDFDGDGALDLAVLKAEDQRVLPLYGGGDATFEARASVPVSGEATEATTVDMVVARLDDDAFDDIVAVNYSEDLQFLGATLFGRADRRFRAEAFVADFQATALAVADFDPESDNGLDAIVGYADFGVTVNVGDGQGRFSDPFIPVGAGGAGVVHSLAAADLNGDDLPDLLVLHPDGDSATVLLNETAPACPGDCNADGTVSIDELLTGVNIAIGGFDPRECLAMDTDGRSGVSIAELIAAVNASLVGCPAP